MKLFFNFILNKLHVCTVFEYQKQTKQQQKKNPHKPLYKTVLKIKKKTKLA